MALTTGGTAQNTRLTLAEAVKSFKTLIGDQTLQTNGQFVWPSRYQDELKSLVQSAVAANDALSEFWFKSRPTILPPKVKPPLQEDSFFGDMMTLATAPIRPVKRTEFERLIGIALASPQMRDGSAGAARVRALLNSSGASGPRAYVEASKLLSAGKRVLPGSPEFARAFPTAGLSFRGALEISFKARDRCFDMAGAVCSFIAKRGGLGTRAPISGARQFGQIFLRDEPNLISPQGFSSGIRRFASPLNDLLAFNPQLPRAVEFFKEALDKGHLLRAGVLSGALAENPTTSPDHFIVLLAWERRSAPFPHTVLAFWDPDADVTNDLEPGFGRLFFLDAQAAQQASNAGPNAGAAVDAPSLPNRPSVSPYSATFYAKSGRLTTALSDAELRTDQSGNFTPLANRTPRSIGTQDKKNHRYQITTVEAVPG